MRPTLAVCIGAFEGGGQGTVVEQELLHLADRFRITLFAERIDRPVPNGVESVVLPTWSPFPRPSPRAVATLGRFDLVHCLDSLGYMACARRSGRPWVVTALGICPPRYRSSARSKVEGTVTLAAYPALYRRASAVVAISGYLGQWVNEFAAVDAEVVPLGVVAVDGTIRDRPPERERLLYVGEISDRKGIHDLMEGLVATPASVGLDLVGRGDIDRFRSVASVAGLADRVRFLGSLPDDDLHRLYGSCFAVCSASHWEGFGLPVLEGFAHARPAIVRDQGGMREQVTESGAGACFVTADQLPRCVDEVRANWRTFSAAGRAYALDHPWSATFDRYERLFRRVLAA